MNKVVAIVSDLFPEEAGKKGPSFWGWVSLMLHLLTIEDTEDQHSLFTQILADLGEKGLLNAARIAGRRALLIHYDTEPYNLRLLAQRASKWKEYAAILPRIVAHCRHKASQPCCGHEYQESWAYVAQEVAAWAKQAQAEK